MCATYLLWSIALHDLVTIEQESNRARVLALTIAESAHQLVEFGGSLDLEEHLVVAIGDFDVEVLTTSRRIRSGTVLLVVGHCVCVCVESRLWRVEYDIWLTR